MPFIVKPKLTLISRSDPDGIPMSPRSHDPWAELDWVGRDPWAGIVAHTNPSLSQVGFKGFDDNGTETGASQKAAENVNWIQPVDQNFRIRFVIDETAGGAESNASFQLQYNLGGAGWNNVDGTSSVVRSSASTHITDDGNTTRILTSGAGTFVAGHFDEVNGLTGTTTWAGGELTEYEYCIQIRSADVADGNTVQLRVIRGTAVVLEGYTQTPSITVSDPATGGFTVATRTGADISDGTSQIITLPNGSNVSGRLVIVALGVDGVGGATWPAGWSELFDAANTETTGSAAYRFIDGTEGFDGADDTITVTTASEQSCYHAYLISAGHHASQAPAAASTLISTPDPPNLTPSWGAEANLWIAMSASRWSGDYTAPPANYSGLLSISQGTPNADSNAPLGTAVRALSAASENPGAFTENGGNNVFVTATIAVRPAAAGDATATPAVIAITAALPQSAITVAAAPTVVPTVSTLPQPTVSVAAAPAVTATTVALPQATADTGGGNATATPAVISTPAALPQAAVGVATTPAVTATTAALPDLDVSVGAAPAVTPFVTALPQAVPDIGGGNATALPAAITATTASPQVTVSIGAAPAATAATVTLPAAGVGITEPVDTITATTAMPLAVPQVGAGPSIIATTASVGDVDVSVGTVPGTIAVVTTLPLVEFVGDVAADVNPVTATVRAAGHTATVRDGGHTATVREMH